MTPSYQIQMLVAEHWQLTRDALVGRDRHKTVRRARLLAMGFCRILTDMSFPEIGRAFDRDHTTAISAFRKTKALLHERERRAVETALFLRDRFRAPLPISESDDNFIRRCIEAGVRPRLKEKIMAISDITNPRDLHRLFTAFREARSRETTILPSIDELVPAVRDAVQKPGDVLDNLAAVFGAPIRRGFELVKEILTENHGREYTADLWARFLKKES